MKRLGETTKPKKQRKKKQAPKISYEYRIILINKGRSVKTLKVTKDRSSALSSYDKEITSNKDVVFPIKYNVHSEVVECDYELLFVRKLNNDDHNLAPEYIFENKFKIIKREPYYLEETFYLFGKDPKSDRLTFNELKEYLIEKTTYIREYGILQNKIIIFNDEDFDMIICKCPEDGMRLGKKLYISLNSPKKFFYRGEYYGGDKPEIVDIINERTGWSRKRIHRNRKNS